MKAKSKMLIVGLASLFLITACSSDSGSTASELAGSSISTLPANTDPVSSSSSSSLAQKAIGALAAATGLKLSDWGDTSNWQSGNSRAMCEVGQALKESLGEAMNPDKIKCYVGAVHKAGGLSGQTIDNGEYFYFKLINFPENPNMEPRIKMRLQKNSSGRITLFEMFSCFEYSGSSYSQSEYILQQINDDLSITSSSKHVGSDGAYSYGGTATVTGQLNSSYQWSSKSMSLARYHTGGGGTHSQEVTVAQNSGGYTVSGYNAGTYGQDIFSNAFYAAVQGLNLSSPKDIALGDGSASYNLDWCYDSNSNASCGDESGGNRHVSTSIDSWDGDNRTNLGTASDGDYYSSVSSATVPSVSSVSAISFDSSEAWDCAAASSFVDADMTNMDNPSTALGAAFAACDAKFQYQDQHSGYACDAAQ